MSRLASLPCAAAILGALVAACSDVGDSSAPPVSGGADSSAEDTGAQDAGNGGDAVVGDSKAPDATQASDADTGAPDTGEEPDGTVTADTGAADTGELDATADTSVEDTSTADTSVADTGLLEDSGTADVVAVQDTGVDSASSEEAGPDATADAPAEDTGSADTGAADTGSDAEVPDALADAAEAGGGLVPCTTPGQTGCVSCQDNANTVNPGLCTPTEALLVEHDIAAGVATAAGNDPADSCYACLNRSFALDDNSADVGNECEDPLAVGTADECRATLSCILGSGTGAPASSCAGAAVNNCYCGSAFPGSTCTMAGAGVNGVCAMQIATGLGFPISDNTDILLNLEDQTRASGIPTELFQNAISNHCAACLN